MIQYCHLSYVVVRFLSLLTCLWFLYLDIFKGAGQLFCRAPVICLVFSRALAEVTRLGRNTAEATCPGCVTGARGGLKHDWRCWPQSGFRTGVTLLSVGDNLETTSTPRASSDFPPLVPAAIVILKRLLRCWPRFPFPSASRHATRKEELPTPHAREHAVRVTV